MRVHFKFKSSASTQLWLWHGPGVCTQGGQRRKWMTLLLGLSSAWTQRGLEKQTEAGGKDGSSRGGHGLQRPRLSTEGTEEHAGRPHSGTTTARGWLAAQKGWPSTEGHSQEVAEPTLNWAFGSWPVLGTPRAEDRTHVFPAPEPRLSAPPADLVPHPGRELGITA